MTTLSEPIMSRRAFNLGVSGLGAIAATGIQGLPLCIR